MVHGQWWIAELQVGVGGWGSVISRSSPVVATHVTGIFPPPSATGDGQNRENHPSKFRYLINFTHSTSFLPLSKRTVYSSSPILPPKHDII